MATKSNVVVDQISQEFSSQGKSNRVKSDFPKQNLRHALSIATTIEETNGGNPMPPTDIAIALDVSPGSSAFRISLSASFKYGLTLGSYRQDAISLTDLGASIALPQSEDARRNSEIDAALRPETFQKIYNYFKGKKIPEIQFFENTVVREFGVPRQHARKCVEVFIANMECVGLIRDAKGGKWLSTERTAQADDTRNNSETPIDSEDDSSHDASMHDIEFGVEDESAARSPHERSIAPLDPQENRVYVSHGKNKNLVPQLKELLTFGQFEPIVSEELESTSIPVPKKVLDDMRSCGAAIIHIDAEQELMTPDGEKEIVHNPNVLIEIGAAMALYGERFILLVKNGVGLPSNLQGLYEVRYSGDKLDGDATLRLLKTFNDFKQAKFSSG